MKYMKDEDENLLYHSTTVENWDEAIASQDFWVHLGTLDAAIQRHSTAIAKQKQVDFYIWQVRIAEGADWEHGIWKDEGCEHRFIESEKDVVPYKNVIEDRGSISYAVRGYAVVPVWCWEVHVHRVFGFTLEKLYNKFRETPKWHYLMEYRTEDNFLERRAVHL